MSNYPEQQSEWIINNNLVNKGWHLDNDGRKNVYFQKPPYPDQQKKLKGKRPDYILYRSGTQNPIAIIEAKKGGVDLQPALKQGTEYAEALNVPLVFAMNGSYCETRFVPNGKSLFLNGNEVRELVRETEALKFLQENSNEVYTIPKEVVVSREDLIRIFKNLNDTLRSEGLRAGIERFSEFANILFLKLLSENGKKSWWGSIKSQANDDIIKYVNGVVMGQIQKAYGGDVFTPLLIKNPRTLRHIIDSLDPLVLSTIGTDIKGDAFEYFLEKTASTENDLGEYFTPRNVVKTVVNLVDPKFKETVYDPFCGTGGFLTGAFHHIRENTIIEENELPRLKNNTLFGREITTTARIAKMNMVLHGDGHSGIEQADSLANPDYLDQSDKAMRFDIIVINMPFSQPITRKIVIGGKAKIENHIAPLYYNGIAKNNGDAACVLHCLRSLKEGGRMALIVPEGFLFKKNIANVREFLLSKIKLQSVISLPPGMFLPYTLVKTDILYFTDAHKPNTQKKYWFFDVKNTGVTLDNHQRKIKGLNDFNKIDSSDIKKVDKNPDLETNMLEIGFKSVDLKNVRKNNYNLVGAQYIKLAAHGDKLISLLELQEKVILQAHRGKSITKNTAQKGNIPVVAGGQSSPYFHNKSNFNGSTITISASGAYAGFVWYHDCPIWASDCAVIHSIKEMTLLTKYLYYVLKGKQDEIYKLQRGSAQPHVYWSDLQQIKIPLPPLEEQEEIVKELDSYQEIIKDAKETISLFEKKSAISFKNIYDQI